MRKLLLASVATLGATLAMSGGAKAQPVKPVAPGTIVVHLNGYLQFEFAGFGSSYNDIRVPGATAVAGSLPAATNLPGGIYKLNPITTDGDARIYPGFDAKTLSGLEYGAQLEIRTTTSDANVGADKVSGTGSAAGTDGFYVKRAYGYVGAPTSGFMRIGQTDGVFTLMQSGVIESFGDGAQFNSDGGVASLLPSAASPGNFIYADASNLYATDKVVYISPAIAGFNVGGSYEPNSNAIKEGYGNNAIANSASAALSSSPNASDIGKRRKNTIDAVLQYVMKSKALVVKASGGVLYGAPIEYTGATPLAAKYGYDNLEVYEAGAQATFAGLTLGASAKGGQVEDSFYFKPKGARDALTYIIGASYVVGPMVLGASYYAGQSAGAYTPGSKLGKTLDEYGVAAGGNYVISPNLSFFVQYLYGHKHQIGNAFGGSSSYVSPLDVTTKVAIGSVGNAQVQALGAGATFKW